MKKILIAIITIIGLIMIVYLLSIFTAKIETREARVWSSDQFVLENFKVVGALRQTATIQAYTKISIPNVTDSLPEYFIHVKYDQVEPTKLTEFETTQTTWFGSAKHLSYHLYIYQDSLLIALAH